MSTTEYKMTITTMPHQHKTMPQQRKNDATKSGAITVEIHFTAAENESIATKNYAIKS